MNKYYFWWWKPIHSCFIVSYDTANTLLIPTPAEVIKGPRINTLRPRQNGRRFADDTFKRIFLNENVRISIKISLNFVPKGPINNNPALVQIMAWRRSGDKSLSEPMMVSLLTLICVTQPQWVNRVKTFYGLWNFNPFGTYSLCLIAVNVRNIKGQVSVELI